jgi:hypothetical protein
MKTPKAPDPMETARAQSAMNLNTAVQSQWLNMTDQVNPWGTVGYEQTGSTRYRDSTGNWVEVPRFTQTTTFTPEQQAIFDKSQAAQTNLAGIAEEQSARVSDALSDPFEFNNQDAADWAFDLASSRILPQQQKNEQALRAQLINSGLRPGTEAWKSEMERLTMANTDQLNQLALTGRNQAFSEALATRNQPLNELSALLSGSQVSNPAQMSSPTPQTQVGGVDYAGLVQDNYRNQVANQGSMLGGLFGLAGSLGSAAIMSDERLKTDKRKVGETDGGLPIYTYRYGGKGPFHMGVMAQDVASEQPEALGPVVDGYMSVKYAEVR